MKKNLYLKLDKDFQDFVVDICRNDSPIHSDDLGIKYTIHFPNGYGASIIKFYGSYGYEQDKWELGLLKKKSKRYVELSVFSDNTVQYSEGKWVLDCDAEITGGDVLGYLNDKYVNLVLGKIKAGEVNERIDFDIYDDYEK